MRIQKQWREKREWVWKREKTEKKGISGKKKERKESENYKTENGRKLVMEDERKERRKDKEKNLAV